MKDRRLPIASAKTNCKSIKTLAKDSTSCGTLDNPPAKVLKLPHFGTYPRHVTLAHAVVHVEPVRGDQAGNVGIKGVKVDRVEPVLKK